MYIRCCFFFFSNEKRVEPVLYFRVEIFFLPVAVAIRFDMDENDNDR